ncbi:hypothetical protein [Pseudomarimonas arenosa]|uniref:MBL fold metallo-hydrolase n=1 Tax=Pseudomarimonas arenosa TaxID=2774145 RepID=A0AAW3ZJN9_9GAMM|nr:hypothetical protein [Pseudomarimonas arenosa]MBD8525387.1 hypothetical protein [Pseudomarimonas arenosa]
MSHEIIPIGDNFWNVRGRFRLGGVVDIGTHCSLIRRQNGKFLFLDAYTLTDSQAEHVDALTGGRNRIEAVLNLHPFHTVHVTAMHQRYPKAKLYGTQRHVEKLPELPWQTLRTEDARLHKKFASDLEFSVPKGVDFVSANENVHFSSVLALHTATQTIHVDDTLIYARLPLPIRLLGAPDLLSFHPTLGTALSTQAGAAQAFSSWAKALAKDWKHARNLCAAHTSVLAAADNRGDSIAQRIKKALSNVSGTLHAHKRKYG